MVKYQNMGVFTMCQKIFSFLSIFNSCFSEVMWHHSKWPSTHCYKHNSCKCCWIHYAAGNLNGNRGKCNFNSLQFITFLCIWNICDNIQIKFLCGLEAQIGPFYISQWSLMAMKGSYCDCVLHVAVNNYKSKTVHFKEGQTAGTR